MPMGSVRTLSCHTAHIVQRRTHTKKIGNACMYDRASISYQATLCYVLAFGPYAGERHCHSDVFGAWVGPECVVRRCLAVPMGRSIHSFMHSGPLTVQRRRAFSRSCRPCGVGHLSPSGGSRVLACRCFHKPTPCTRSAQSQDQEVSPP